MLMGTLIFAGRIGLWGFSRVKLKAEGRGEHGGKTRRTRRANRGRLRAAGWRQPDPRLGRVSWVEPGGTGGEGRHQRVVFVSVGGRKAGGEDRSVDGDCSDLNCDTECSRTLEPSTPCAHLAT